MKKLLLILSSLAVLWLITNNAVNWHYHELPGGQVIMHAHPYDREEKQDDLDTPPLEDYQSLEHYQRAEPPEDYQAAIPDYYHQGDEPVERDPETTPLKGQRVTAPNEGDKGEAPLDNQKGTAPAEGNKGEEPLDNHQGMASSEGDKGEESSDKSTAGHDHSESELIVLYFFSSGVYIIVILILSILFVIRQVTSKKPSFNFLPVPVKTHYKIPLLRAPPHC